MFDFQADSCIKYILKGENFNSLKYYSMTSLLGMRFCKQFIKIHLSSFVALTILLHILINKIVYYQNYANNHCVIVYWHVINSI